jgi:Ca2+-binding EF-hand superfamily protein
VGKKLESKNNLIERNMTSRTVDRSSTLGRESVRKVERKLPKLTEEQILEFKEAFKLFDKDNGGSIDVDELKDALESLGQIVTEESVQELVDEVDEDGSGEIEFDEFLVLMSRQILNSDVVSRLNFVYYIISYFISCTL